MTGRNALRSAWIAALLVFGATGLRAQCAIPGATHVSWPGVNPVWDLCVTRPDLSSGGNGSGLELSEVKYKGTLVIARAHMPVLNVKYVANAGGCGGAALCYRDWFYSEQAFSCAPTVSPGVCTGPTTPTSTVCQHPGTDAGSFNGVAVESLSDRLKLTAQCEAGWYRYIPIWEFFADGTIQSHFVATSVNHTCVAYTHHHHGYFRLDLDVNGSAGNYVDEVLAGNTLQRVTSERNFIDTSPARSKWRVASAGSPYAVEVTRNAGDDGAGDPFVIANDFPVADGWVLAYSASEISDYPNEQFNFCPANLDSYDNNQNVNGADIVLWVRAAALHQGEPGGIAADCSMVGPTIRVLSTAPGTALNTVTPCRIVDTRNAAGPYGGPALSAGLRTFALAGQCGIPSTAKSVSANVTVIQPDSGGFLTAFPAGGATPTSSTINFSAGQVRANNAILELGTGGAVTVSTSVTGTVQFVLDVNGWFE